MILTEEKIMELLPKCDSRKELLLKLGFNYNGGTRRTLRNFCKSHDIDLTIFDTKLTEEKYNASPKHCIYCGKVIPYEKRENNFCNSSCSAAYNNSGKRQSKSTKEKISQAIKKIHSEHRVYRTCIVCGKKYYYQPHINTKKMCSKECSNFYKEHTSYFLSESSKQKLSDNMKRNLEFMSCNKRSKNEIYFYELCSCFFKKVEPNARIFNGWDADVVIHDIKYAVMWNGIWHYKQVTKKHNLTRTQNRDRQKYGEIIKCKYTPYIIKDMGAYNKTFVEEQFNSFIEYLKINKILPQ